MSKRVILITGTPCTGKTTIAKRLTIKLNALYINLTELANAHSLIRNEDKRRKTIVIHEKKMRAKIIEIIKTAEKSDIIIDGHYASVVIPTPYVTRVFVLRRNPIELSKLMKKRGFVGAKLWENLASEILDVCLVEALQYHTKEIVCELDITGKRSKAVVAEILTILNENRECSVGHVDWLSMLETKGLLDEYLKF